MTDGPAFLKDSICSKCSHKVRRVVVPVDTSGWDFDVYDQEDYVKALENGDEIKFEHIMCAKLHLDLDHIVLECECYCEKTNTNGCLIKDERVLDLLT